MTGTLVPVDDGDDAFEAGLGRALDAVLGDAQAARRMGEAGRARAVREFGWDAVARRTVRLYEEIVKQA